MVWCCRGRILGDWGRNRSKHGVFVVVTASCFLALLCVGQSEAVKSSTEGSLSTEGVGTTTTTIGIGISNGENSNNPKVNPVSAKNISEDSIISSEDERFQVAAFDWVRVQTPMLLGLAILACTLAKLSEYILCLRLFTTTTGLQDDFAKLRHHHSPPVLLTPAQY